MKSLLTYAIWLEQNDVNWFHFPSTKSERCLNRFRGDLIRARDNGEVSPSTASNTMANVIQFYRWVQYHDLIDRQKALWRDTVVAFKTADRFGFERTMKVATSELKIPFRRPSGVWDLEDGVQPVSLATRDAILAFAKEHASKEIYLMLGLGFSTGMRIGSICDLKEQTIQNATQAPIPGFHQLNIGPGARPSVHTKASRRGASPTGRVLIPDGLLEAVNLYLWSERRIDRKIKASKDDANLLFLTSRGHHYRGRDDTHPAVSDAIYRLRKLAKVKGEPALADFHFHRARATFATQLTMCALDALSSTSEAIKFVRDACLHKDEATTMLYINFIEQSKELAEASAKFTDFFMGSWQ